MLQYILPWNVTGNTKKEISLLYTNNMENVGKQEAI